ncbi:MAG: ABC transporter permease subunit [Deltaproteobacteria bacterium]|nr:ABC transporter permease subunit [Deltaproteobacteria bacterium]
MSSDPHDDPNVREVSTSETEEKGTPEKGSPEKGKAETPDPAPADGAEPDIGSDSPAETQEPPPKNAEAGDEAARRPPKAVDLANTDLGKAATQKQDKRRVTPQGVRGRTYRVRGEIPFYWRFAMGTVSIGIVGIIWWWVTRGAAEERVVSPAILGSPEEVFGSFHSLWFDRALTRNTLLSLGRVLKGFGLSLFIGIPLGILSGVFPRFRAFLAPITVSGRNIPVAALVPLTLVWFGIGETQKLMFIFMASVAFIVFDTTETVLGIDQKYVDTAYTLGATRWQIIFKVIVPLALPDIFNSARLLLGLGFGYIILVEIVGQEGGLGNLITTSQRRGPREHVYLTLMVITLVAYFIDRVVSLIGTYLFPYKESR